MPGTDVAVRVGVVGAEQFSQTFKSMGGDVSNFASLATGKFTNLGVLFSTVGGGIMYAGNQLLVGVKDFDAAMRNVQTVSQSARVSLQQVSDAVIGVAQATTTSATEAAKGMYQIVSSGYDGADAIKVLQAALVSASAGLTDTDTAARAVTSVLNAYALSANDAKDVSDILFQTVNLGVGTFEELAGTIGDVVGIGAQMGVPFADISSAIAAASRAGQSFGEATTGISRIFQDLLSPSTAMTETLRRMGYESGQTALQQLGLQGVLTGIRQEVGNNASAYVALFSRIDSIQTALALAANEGQNYADVAGQITDKQARANAAQKAFDIQMRGLNMQAKELRNSLFTFGQSGLVPVIHLFEQVGSVTATVFDALTKLHPAIKAFMVVGLLAFGAFSLLVGVALLALPKMAVVAAVAIGRQIIMHHEAALAALEQAMANSILVRSLWEVTKFSMDANLAKTTLFTGIKTGAWIGALVGIAVAFDMFYKKGETVATTVQKINDKISDVDLTAVVKAFSALISETQNLNVATGSLNAIGLIVDTVAQTHLSLFTNVKEAEKAIRELAASNPVAAQRMIESARAAGVNEYALYKMEKALWDAKVAQDETTKATGLGAQQFQTAGGQIITITDALKTQLDELRSSAQSIADSFGGMFGDAEEQLTGLKDASSSAAKSVTDAQKGVDDAVKNTKDVRANASREHTKNLNELSKAQRDLDNLTLRKPRRQRGERREDFEARIAEEIATAKDKVADANARIAAEGGKLTDAVNKETESTTKLTDAKAKQKKADEELVITGDKLLARIKEQQKQQQQYFDNLTKISQRLGQSGALFVQELRAKGPKEGGAEASALAGMSDKDLTAFFGTWKSIQAISTGTALIGTAAKLMPAQIQANLEELWSRVGGDVSKFVELGAEYGEKELRTFIDNKIPQGATDTINKLTGAVETALAPQYELKIKAVFADDSAKIPGITVPLDEFSKQKIDVPISVMPTAPPTPPPEPPKAPDTDVANLEKATLGGTGGLSPISVGKAVGSWLWRNVPHAEGGVENHQAMMGSGTTRIWNEPETGGEAYIPLSLSKRARSEGILDQVAGIFGGKFQKFADGGVHGGSKKITADEAAKFLMEHGSSLFYGAAAAERTIAEKTGVKSVLKTPSELLAEKIKAVMMKGVIENWRAKGYVLSKSAETGRTLLAKVGGGEVPAEIYSQYGADVVGAANFAGQAANLGLVMYQFGQVSSAATPDKFKIGGQTYSLPPHVGIDKWLREGGTNVINSKNQLVSLASLGAGPLDVARQVKSHGWWGASKHKPGLMPISGVAASRSFNPTHVAQRAMLQGGIFRGGGGGGTSTTDSSTHIAHTYSVGQVVTPDPAAFEQWANNRQRMNALAGL